MPLPASWKLAFPFSLLHGDGSEQTIFASLSADGAAIGLQPIGQNAEKPHNNPQPKCDEAHEEMEKGVRAALPKQPGLATRFAIRANPTNGHVARLMEDLGFGKTGKFVIDGIITGS
jgi:hypothetical protein